MFLLVSTLILCTVSDALQVIGGNQTVVQGETAILPCKLIDNKEKLSQISWQRMTRAKPQMENFYTILYANGPKFVNGVDHRFKFVGNFTDNNGSLRLSNVTLMDEGTYACIFTLFPSGNVKTEIPLQVLVPPVSSLEDNNPVLGDVEVSLVTCTAACARPPAVVTWLTGTLEGKVRATINTIKHDNGTATTVSSLFGVPTREIYNHQVKCVVTNAALSQEENLNFAMQVYFPPLEVNIRHLANGSFECVTEANPNAVFTWSRSDNTWPQSALRVGAWLEFQKMAPNLNGLYQCEASNTHGKNRSHLYLHVSSGVCTVCWVLFILLLLLIALAAAAAAYLYKSGKFRWISETTSREMPRVSKTHVAAEEEEEEEEATEFGQPLASTQ